MGIDEIIRDSSLVSNVRTRMAYHVDYAITESLSTSTNDFSNMMNKVLADRWRSLWTGCWEPAIDRTLADMVRDPTG